MRYSHILDVFLGRSFLSGLRTLKPKKPLKNSSIVECDFDRT